MAKNGRPATDVWLAGVLEAWFMAHTDGKQTEVWMVLKRELKKRGYWRNKRRGTPGFSPQAREALKRSQEAQDIGSGKGKSLLDIVAERQRAASSS